MFKRRECAIRKVHAILKIFSMSMSSKLIGVGVVALVIIGLGAFWFMNTQSTNELGGSDENTVESGSGATDEATTSEATPSSLKNLLALGRAQQCTFSDSTTYNQGIVYVGNNKARGNFTSANNGQEIVSHMIVDGEAVYIWIDGAATGFKTALNATQPTEATTQTQQFDADTTVNYRCEPWVVDPAAFTLPSGVQFSDTSALFPSAQGQAGTNNGSASDSKAAQCAACDSAPAEARTQCRAALGCN